MKWSMVMAVMIAVARVADAAEPGQHPAIHLQMDNQAEVPAAILKNSQDEVVRIFADAGVAVEWTQTGPSLTVQIVTSALGYADAASTVMGVALRTPGGATAQIFFKQVQDFARRCHVDVSRLLAFGHELSDAETCHLLVHCHAGVSRSTAATALILAQAHPDRPARDVFDAVSRLRPRAWPNLRILEFGDELLGRGGEIVAAAGPVYRRVLDREPSFREAMIEGGRAREVIAALSASRQG